MRRGRRAWALFAVALALALSVTIGLGWARAQRTDTAPTHTATRDRPAEVRGVRWSMGSYELLDELPSPSAFGPVVPVRGAVLVRVVIDQEFLAGVPDDSSALTCELTLHSDSGEWGTDLDASAALEEVPTCAPLLDRPKAGDRRRLVVVFEAPREHLTNPWVGVRFTRPAETLALRP